jgi:hypothetical protein
MNPLYFVSGRPMTRLYHVLVYWSQTPVQAMCG